ncbi:MAG TPA: ATP-binding protein [Thermodesulfovibrionales bacterium]|nr:ATP-binding protein [Thermodesulfovibrionales bacterium]
MSLKKKIAFGFIISSSIIAILVIFEYVSFVQIRREIRSLEVADSIRSKTLELRRHEKNFFLFGQTKGVEETKAILRYLTELDSIIAENLPDDRAGGLSSLRALIQGYGKRFRTIEALVNDLSGEFDNIRPSYGRYALLLYLKSAFLDRPRETADFLKDEYGFSRNARLIKDLWELYSETNALRKNGEDILIASKNLDSAARAKVERVISISQGAILAIFPLFLIVGIGTLFFISGNIVSRLHALIDTVEKTGKGNFPRMSLLSGWGRNDEVGLLIEKFNTMEEQLARREEELERKNRELLQSKKLAAIGTLASGVAHELNNPLNNIYISSQVLEKEVHEACSPTVEETVNDILTQTVRVKRIVGDLLEFARGSEPRLARVDLKALISGAYRLVSTTTDTSRVNFILESDSGDAFIDADSEQLERVFINLFTNAVDAMSGSGNLSVRVQKERTAVTVKISDTGKGMSAEDTEKIFEPFYTTKDKGTGLGLAIVFNIIKRHSGEIVAESGTGKGTTFVITLPVRGEGHEL